MDRGVVCRGVLDDPDQSYLLIDSAYDRALHEVAFASDEHIRPDTTAESLARLPAADSVQDRALGDVLAEIGAARSGEMREIVATIQAEQDVVIRSPLEQVLIVQGGPGTGKTAVALHRAAYLLFEYRGRLARDGVLVVGPNRAFLDYIGHVLPSLGERSVRQTTVEELCIPRVEIGATDDAEMARWKGAAERVDELEHAALAAIVPPDDDVRVPIGARTHVIDRDLFAGWLDTAKDGISPINERRERLRSLARRELLRRTGSDDAWTQAGELKKAIAKAKKSTWLYHGTVKSSDTCSNRAPRPSHANVEISIAAAKNSLNSVLHA